MAHNVDLRIGERIELEIDDNKGDKRTYISQIYNILDNNCVVIAGPIEQKRFILLSIDQMLSVVYYRPDGCYKINARVVKRERINDLFNYTLEFIGERQRLQRRAYFRLKITLPMQYRLINKNNGQIDENWYKAYVIDISGGGIRMIASQRLNNGDILLCRIDINTDNIIEVKGQVVRCIPYDDDPNKWDIGISFIDIYDKLRDDIIHFIFEQQTELLRKGLRW